MQRAAASLPILYYLSIARGGFAVPARGLHLGNGAGNDIALPSPQVAERHATIWTDRGRCYIHDWGSGYPTAVNGRRVFGTLQLKPGDIVAIGPWAFQVRGTAGSPTPQMQYPAVPLTGGQTPATVITPLRWIVIAALTAIVTFTVLLGLALALIDPGNDASGKQSAPTVVPSITLPPVPTATLGATVTPAAYPTVTRAATYTPGPTP
jgi:hypothetical protein